MEWSVYYGEGHQDLLEAWGVRSDGRDEAGRISERI